MYYGPLLSWPEKRDHVHFNKPEARRLRISHPSHMLGICADRPSSARTQNAEEENSIPPAQRFAEGTGADVKNAYRENYEKMACGRSSKLLADGARA